jgi:phosphoribosylformylglycinamidine synthase
VTLEAGGPGELLYVVGETGGELGCTEYAAHRGSGGPVPRCRPEAFHARYERVAAAVAGGLVTAAHAPGRGGLARSLFLLARAAGLGLAVDLSLAPGVGSPGWEELLFSESTGRFLLAVTPEGAVALEERLAGLPVARIGAYDAGGRLRIASGAEVLVDESVEILARAWKREGGRP